LIAALTCLAVAAGLGAAIGQGAPGVLNLAMLWLMWTGLKIGWLVPASLIWTIRARLVESGRGARASSMVNTLES
jgi:hypothetical protein